MENIMKKLTFLAYPLVALLSLAAAGVAFADDITPDSTASVPSLKTRAQVQAELQQARANGSIKVWSTSYNPLTVAKTERTRAEVRAERDSRFDVAMYGEDSGSFALSRLPAVRVAAPLLAAN
jgi:hypothetical protein